MDIKILGKSVVVDDRSGKPDRLSPAGYSKEEYGRSWSSREWKIDAAAHDRSGKPNVVQNEENLTLKQMFDITAQTIHNDEEMYCLDKIEYQRNTWTQLSLINDPVVIGLQSAKVYVFSDSVLCLGKVLQHPECNEAWKNRVAGIRAEKNYSDFEDVKGESTEFEWNIFPGFTTLQLCDKINNLLSSLGQSLEAFTGRILFMSMFNDISCDGKDNKEQCLKNADFVKTFA